VLFLQFMKVRPFICRYTVIAYDISLSLEGVGGGQICDILWGSEISDSV